MAMATCELIWIKQLFQELKFGDIQQMRLCCGNQVAFHIAHMFHERTKHIEIDQQVDTFTKSLRGPHVNHICGKFGVF